MDIQPVRTPSEAGARLLSGMRRLAPTTWGAWAGLIGSLDKWLPLVTAAPLPSALPGTADIFISYSSDKRAKAARLAKQLQSRGYSVWFDFQLVPTGRYRADIEARLNAAQAVIVIWSKAAINSDWVEAEASHARRQGKLINVRTPDVKAPDRELPMPFGVTRCARIGDIDAIVAALTRLMVPTFRPTAEALSDAIARHAAVPPVTTVKPKRKRPKARR